MATRATRPSSLPEKTGALWPSGRWIFARRRNTNTSASTQLTPWHRNVAHATPSTPMPNAVTNRISTAMFERDEAMRKKNGVLESPSAEKIPVATL